jgi:phosphatidylserine/phosphatidylglycerophosphate/cardiolipin synthase-like enzyme
MIFPRNTESTCGQPKQETIMRFKSKAQEGFQIFAVTGINTISFAIKANAKARKGLLGFAVERADPAENQRYYMYGFKVFKSILPHPDETTQVSTHDHPVQSLVWDDFTAKSGRKYDYYFHPLRGEPRNLDRSADPIKISVETEPLFSKQEHDVFFNRGVASSQAYSRRFNNLRPDKQPTPEKRQEAFDWLSRDLLTALLQFIKNAKPNDGLLCCFYEFRYAPVAEGLKSAVDRGVDVQIIFDAKVNEYTDKKGTFHPSFPREDNLDTQKEVGLPKGRIHLREARTSSIAHNKFMVLLRGKGRKAAEVWTGSTNISDGGIFGQTNVGHWVRNADVATQFEEYWNLLKDDPGGTDDDDRSTVRQKNAKLSSAVEGIKEVPLKLDDIPKGTTAVFSPRTGIKVLEFYFDLVLKAEMSSAITLAFGINRDFKEELQTRTADDQIMFMLLEKKDAPTARNRDTFVTINAKNNVYQAWGSFLKDPLYQWTKEVNTRILQLNQHVSYVHSKFMLRDPLGADPIIVTGSANFSAASTNSNDENMLIIRGDLRAADIYFTEFNRIFNHYYFRAITETTRHSGNTASDGSLFLQEAAEKWLVNYAPGKLRQKRVDLYAKMEGIG